MCMRRVGVSEQETNSQHIEETERKVLTQINTFTPNVSQFQASSC